MKNKNRAILFLLTVIIAVSSLMAAEIIVDNYDHDCIGDQCLICVICAKCSDWTNSLGLPELSAAAKILFCFVLIFVKAKSTAVVLFDTPVILKDKISD